MAVVLQHHILHVSLLSYLSSSITLIYANKHKVNVKVKNKTERKDLTLKSLILYCNSVKDFESCFVIQYREKNKTWHSSNRTLKNRRRKEQQKCLEMDILK